MISMNEIINVPLNNGKVQQFLAAISVNLLSISGGISCGWPSPVIPQLLSSNPPVGDAPMSEKQISWISTLLPVGSLLIIPFCGILSERLGRKKFAYLSALPQIMSWLLIIIGQNHICLYVARLLIGMSTAMTIFISPMYISEIASEDIRGVLGGLMMFSANVGILIAYVAGALLSYRLFASLALVFPLVFLVAFAPMPETPAFLVRRNRHLDAHKSLMFLRGNNKILVERELHRLVTHSKILDNASKTVRLREFFDHRATRMGLIISFILLGSQQLSGILAVLSYAEMVFQRAGSSISPHTAPIIIAVIQIFGSYISTMLMDRAGRRLLILISCFGMATSHLFIGLFFNLQRYDYNLNSISWLPLVAFSTYIAFYCLGIGPVPFVFTSEVFGLDVSSSATTFCYVFYWAMSSVVVKTFGSAMDILGVDVCFFVLAGSCVACFVLSYCMMPETKGRKREDIVNELGKFLGDETQRKKNSICLASMKNLIVLDNYFAIRLSYVKRSEVFLYV